MGAERERAASSKYTQKAREREISNKQRPSELVSGRAARAPQQAVLITNRERRWSDVGIFRPASRQWGPRCGTSADEAASKLAFAVRTQRGRDGCDPPAPYAKSPGREVAEPAPSRPIAATPGPKSRSQRAHIEVFRCSGWASVCATRCIGAMTLTRDLRNERSRGRVSDGRIWAACSVSGGCGRR